MTYTRSMHGARHRAYARPPKGHPGMWVSRRDYEHAQVRGFSVMPDLVHVPAENLVLEVDSDRLHSRPIGVITKPDNISHVVRHARTERSEENILVRLHDLVDAASIAKRSGRARATIDRFRSYPDFPKPVRELGRSHVWLWWQIATWFKARGLRITLKKVGYRREGAVGNTDAGSD